MSTRMIDRQLAWWPQREAGTVVAVNVRRSSYRGGINGFEKLPAHIQAQRDANRQEKHLQCVKRDRAVPATPEERVRQRILRWLVEDKEWPVQKIELERSYDWVGDPNRQEFAPTSNCSTTMAARSWS